MKRRALTVILTVVISCSLVACGSSTPSESMQDTEDNTEQNAGNTTDSSEAGETAASSSEAVDSNRANNNSGHVETFDASFDVYEYYEPNEQIVNSTIYDGCYIQIGNSVLELGKSTIEDYINAGVDLYDIANEDCSSRDKEMNEYKLGWIEWSEFHKFSVRGYLGDFVELEFICIPENAGIYDYIENPLDAPITSVSVQYNVFGLNLIENVYKFIHSDEFKPVNSLYVTGGYYLGGLISDVNESFGKNNREHEQELDQDGVHIWNRSFINKEYENDPGNLNLLQIGSSDYMATYFFLKAEKEEVETETVATEEITSEENPENNEPEFNYEVAPIVFENFAMCYDLIGAEDYDYLQQCVEAFTESISIRNEVSTVTLNEGSLAIDSINKSFEIVFNNGDTYSVVMSPSIYPRDHAVDFSFYSGNEKLFSSDESF